MLESLVDTAFSADTRLGTFLQSVASKETAAWDVLSFGQAWRFPLFSSGFHKTRRFNPVWSTRAASSAYADS